MLKKIVLLILLVFILIQFIQIDKNNPSYDAQQDFFNHNQARPEVKNLIISSCYDCHSNDTKYPWYSYIQPVGCILNNHIIDGRKHLNFSVWNTYDAGKKSHKLEECYEEIENGNMPLKAYTLTHPEANLSTEQKNLLTNYFKTAAGH